MVPARVRKPRDKAKVEAGVLLVERWILARLRHRVFTSLTALNRAIRERLEELKRRPFKQLPGCRRAAFERLDRPALRPLPATPDAFAEWQRATVHVDYHVELQGQYYSVPHALVGRRVDLRHTATPVEVFHHGQRGAAHAKVGARGRFTTVEAHMPTAHRQARWSPERLLRWAEQTGPHTAAFVTAVLHRRRHPEQGFRTCLGVLRLGERYTPARLEAACPRALALQALRYRSVDSILAHGLDTQPLAQTAATPSQDHAHLRGPTYFH